MAFEAGQAFISVSPSLRNFNKSVRSQLKKELAGVNADIPIDGDFSGLKRKATREGADAGGEFGRSFRRRVTAALQALPEINVDADTSEADTEIAGLRARMEALRDLRIGVDIDADEANRELQEIRGELARINADDSRVDVQADTAAAMAQLAAVDREVARLDGRVADVDVDVDRDGSALRSAIFLHNRISGLALAGATLGPALVPALAAATAAAGGLASALGSATVGVGALVAASVPSVTAISEALQAQEQAQKSAFTSTVQLQRQQLQQDRAAEQAAERVADARRNAARTAEDGALRVEAAQRRVADSEVTLERAIVSEQRAQEALTEARRDAARALEDLREQVSDLALSEESAQISLEESRRRLQEAQDADQSVEIERAQISLADAQQRLADVTGDAAASERERRLAQLEVLEAEDRLQDAQRRAQQLALDRRKAELGVLEAEDRLSDVRRDKTRTTRELNEAERAGIDGADQVVSAQRRLEDAAFAVAEATRDNQQAEQVLVRTRRDAAEATADAARQVSEALEAQAHQAQLARLETEQGTSAQRNLAFAMSELTPMQRQLMDGWIRLRDAFTGWSRALEPATIPVFLEGMRLLERILPLLTPIVEATAGAFGRLLERAGEALEAPFWRRFFGWLADTAGPNTETFGRTIGNLVAGFAGLVMAFGPLAADMGEGLRRLSERFAAWGMNLESDQAFQGFVSYVRENWPQLRETLSALIDALTNIVTAVAPLGGPFLIALEAIASVIAVMPPQLIVAIAGALAGMAIALKAVALGMALLNANPIVAIISVIAALVLVFIHAYRESETFRNIVNSVFRAIADVYLWVWRTFLKPIFDALVAAFRFAWDVAQVVGRGISAAWDRMGDDLGAVWGWIKRNVISPLVDGFQWAWDKAVEIKDGIVGAFRSMRDTVKQIFKQLIDNVKGPIGAAFGWINDNLIDNLNKVTTKFGLEIPSLPEFHSGGVIPGRGETPIMALGGEGVVSPQGMKAIGGEQGLDAINSGMSSGGPFDWVPDPVASVAGAIGSQIGDWLKAGAAFALDKIFGVAIPAVRDFMPHRPEFAHDMIVGGLRQLRSAAKAWGDERDAMNDGSTPGSGSPGDISRSGWSWVLGRPYRIGRGSDAHGYPAQDLPAPTGTPIYAASSGQVVQSLDSPYSYGRRVMVNHHGIRGVYAHMSQRLAQLGDIVRAGQRIGLVGSTGNSTGPHLHLELGRFDPLSFLRQQGVSYDSGGYLPPGLSLAYNGTGGHERVLDRTETRTYERGRGVHVDHVTVQAWTDRFSLRQVQDELAFNGG